VQLSQHTTILGVPHSVPLHASHAGSGTVVSLGLADRSRRSRVGCDWFLAIAASYVVWNWQAVAVVRSDPVLDQLNHPAWPDGLPVAWSLNSGS